MSEMTMPKGGGQSSSEGGRSKQMQRVQQARAIAPNDHIPRLEILHRTTSRVKFNRTIIIGSELAHRDQILNKFWRNNNIIER
jgi:hypothetical protein